MIHKKRFFYPTLLAALLCGAVAVVLHAEDPASNPPQPPPVPPPSPLFDALDVNHDGIISADEIANASAALRTLLKNGAVEIKRADVEPPHPPAAHDRRDRDDQDRDAPDRPRPHAMRPPHASPPADDRDDDDAAPRPRLDDDRADRPHHRPPPPRWREDDEDMDAPPAHHRPEPADRGDRPPRRADDEDRAMDEGARPRLRRDQDADRPSHRHPPGSPLFDALDTNHDGVISADEIEHAPDALKKLDKSGSGQIRREDLRPMQPPRDND